MKQERWDLTPWTTREGWGQQRWRWAHGRCGRTSCMATPALHHPSTDRCLFSDEYTAAIPWAPWRWRVFRFRAEVLTAQPLRAMGPLLESSAPGRWGAAGLPVPARPRQPVYRCQHQAQKRISISRNKYKHKNSSCVGMFRSLKPLRKRLRRAILVFFLLMYVKYLIAKVCFKQNMYNIIKHFITLFQPMETIHEAWIFI